ncbi:MAG: helix-turn-helix transcriptional regulator, partial [Leptolyngbya sp. SIO4C1]|nr:helix-turn-helix transcriptional regulator [Leptolyngbya sp. SIO4C1]
EIQLRDGIWLTIDRHQPVDCLLINESEEEYQSIWYIFTLSGKGQLIVPSALSETLIPRTAGKYTIESNGLSPRHITDESDIDPYCHVFIFVRPSVLRSFAASPERELPESLQHLVKDPGQEIYRRGGDITPTMAVVLQQILSCSYQSIVKRAYLEGKVIELIALVLDHEIAIQQGDVKQDVLKSEQRERIYYAREILLKDLDNPPSIAELAHLVGLNEGLLKRGFRQAFGTTVFDTLQSHRLDIARQLLAEQDISIFEVAQHAGYGSATTFGRAFRKKFGVSPKQYQKACR